MNLKNKIYIWRWWLLTIVTALWLLLVTMWPTSHPTARELNLQPLVKYKPVLVCLLNDHCTARRLSFWLFFIDVLGNIVVFIPLGVGLAGILSKERSRWQTVYQAALIGLAFSLTIELLQLAITYRVTDVDDVIFNTFGTLVGTMLYEGIN